MSNNIHSRDYKSLRDEKYRGFSLFMLIRRKNNIDGETILRRIKDDVNVKFILRRGN